AKCPDHTKKAPRELKTPGRAHYGELQQYQPQPSCPQEAPQLFQRLLSPIQARKKNIGAQKCVTQRVPNNARLVCASVSGSKRRLVKKARVWSSAIQTMMIPRNPSMAVSRVVEATGRLATELDVLDISATCIGQLHSNPIGQNPNAIPR